MNDTLADLIADVRQRCRDCDREEAQAIADLPDQDLVWLVANGWQPPAAAPARPANAGTWGSFVLTQEQYREYLEAVTRAKETRNLLNVTQARGNTAAIAELRLLLQRQADEIRALSDQWQVER